MMLPAPVVDPTHRPTPPVAPPSPPSLLELANRNLRVQRHLREMVVEQREPLLDPEQ